MRSARPFTVNNSGIDARDGQAYHGRTTTITKAAAAATFAACFDSGNDADQFGR
jgi:hypothetical protein